MELRLALDQTTGAGHVAGTLPPIRMTIDTMVRDVAPGGVATVAYTYSGIDVVDDGSLDAPTFQSLAQQLAVLNGVSGTLTVTPRNVSQGGTLQLPPGASGSAQQVFDEASKQLSDLAVPFPRPAVGVGARWRVSMAREVSGITARQHADYRLRARDANTVTLEVSIDQRAAPQRADVPGLRPGATVDLTVLRTTGNGQTTIDVTDTLPVTTSVHANSNQQFTIRQSGDVTTASQQLTLDMTLSRP
jgi:hypothetical protein